MLAEQKLERASLPQASSRNALQRMDLYENVNSVEGR
jgi:hypothetical protein